MTVDSAVLKASNLSVGYVGQPVVRDVSFTVRPGEVVCLLGPNGAGKTTTLLGITGVLPLMAGTVEMLDGLTDEPLYRKARAGLSFVTEERSIIRSLTTSENIRCAGLPIESVTALFPELESRLTTRAGLLSGGEQQMLTMCRTLIGDPEFIMIDEPTEGLSPQMTQRVAELLKEIARRGVATLLVEQKLSIAMDIANRVYVMGHGQVVFEGTPAELKEREDVRKEWLEV